MSLMNSIVRNEFSNYERTNGENFLTKSEIKSGAKYLSTR